MPRLPFRTLAIMVLIALSIALYREWIARNQPPLFLPLGFFEQAVPVVSPETQARDSTTWEDTIEPYVLNAPEFDALVFSMGAEENESDVLVTGATLGGTAAALAAAEDGLSVTLVASKEWRTELLAEAGEFSAQRLFTDSYGSTIERELRRILRSSTNSGEGHTNGLPSDVEAFFASLLESSKSVRILSPYNVVALGRGDDGRIVSALLQSPNGETSLVARFDYIIDGTNDGSTLAHAGVASRSSWGQEDAEGEPETPSEKAYIALAEGYTMSGRTVPGMGKRLAGSKMYMGVRDKGYNGWFIPPSEMDACWQSQHKAKTFVQNVPHYRAGTVGCEAVMRFDASFSDTIELFWINHGNDSLQATVTIGSGRTLAMYVQINPATKFARLGAFPVTPGNPVIVKISSVLPTDRLEGIIARKMNAGGRATSFEVNGTDETVFGTDGWEATSYDVYAVSSNDAIINEASIDGTAVRASSAGRNTFVFRDVLLGPGEHAFRLENDVGRLSAIAIPVGPGRGKVMLSPPLVNPPQPGYSAWAFIAPRDGKMLFTAQPDACEEECFLTVTESGSLTSKADAHVIDGLEIVSMSYPLFTVDVSAGKTYVVSANPTYDVTRPPEASMLNAGADMHAFGTDDLRIVPTNAGNAYDVWIRTRWSSNTTVTMPTGKRSFGASDRWQYVTTDVLGRNGVTVDGGGYVEILAMPNTFIDTYHVPLGNGGPSLVEGLPYGTYNMLSFGIENPERINVINTSDGTVEVREFRGINGMYAADQPFVHGSGSFIASPTNQWPQTLVLYEHIQDEESVKTTFGSGALLLVLDGKAMDAAHPGAYAGRANDSAGAFLFTPMAEGIGPVTIGRMDSLEATDRLRRYLNDAYLLLRYGKTNLIKPIVSCSIHDDPTCDPRRYVRDPLVFGTPDALAPIPVYPEGRRIDGRDKLMFIDSHAVIRSCMDCSNECVAGTHEGKSCIRKDTSEWNRSAIVSFPGIENVPMLSSPLEEKLQTLDALFQNMRRDDVTGLFTTYFERPSPPRDVTLTLDMIVSSSESNILSANATISATHGGATAIRSPTAELLIGSAAGHAVGFAAKHEYASLAVIADSEPATQRLQRYLIDQGVNVIPMGGIDDDPLLLKAIQWRVLDGRATLEPSWINGRLTYKPHLPDGEDVNTLKRLAFGETSVETVKDALRWFDGSDVKPDNVELLRLGLKNGFVNDKMLMLSLDEIMGQALNEDLLLKAEYLLRAH